MYFVGRRYLPVCGRNRRNCSIEVIGDNDSADPFQVVHDVEETLRNALAGVSISRITDEFGSRAKAIMKVAEEYEEWVSRTTGPTGKPPR